MCQFNAKTFNIRECNEFAYGVMDRLTALKRKDLSHAVLVETATYKSRPITMAIHEFVSFNKVLNEKINGGHASVSVTQLLQVMVPQRFLLFVLSPFLFQLLPLHRRQGRVPQTVQRPG